MESIISIPLINYYLERHNVSTKFVSVEDSSEIKNFSTTYDSSKQVIMVGDNSINLISNQVENGIPTRMALLYLLGLNKKN